MAIKGKDFILEVEQNGSFVPVACATDFTLSIDSEAREISGPQGVWRDYIGGFIGYALSVPGLVEWLNSVNYLQLEELQRNRTKFRWRGGTSLPTGVVHSGTILITNLTMTAQFRDALKYDMSAIGCGPKETTLLPTPSSPYLADENKVRLPGCPNPYPVGVYWYSADGNSIGTFIGIAFNNDDVVELLNTYEDNEFYSFSVGSTGCDFNALSDWNAPFVPDVIFAQATPELGLSPDQINDMGLTPDQDQDQLISPAYS